MQPLLNLTYDNFGYSSLERLSQRTLLASAAVFGGLRSWPYALKRQSGALGLAL